MLDGLTTTFVVVTAAFFTGFVIVALFGHVLVVKAMLTNSNHKE